MSKYRIDSESLIRLLTSMGTAIASDPEGEHEYQFLVTQTSPERGKVIVISSRMIDHETHTDNFLVNREEKVDHPAHYGGDTTYEAIKVIEAWGLNFHLGNAVKYICRMGAKGGWLENVDKAIWYLQRYRDKRLEEEG